MEKWRPSRIEGDIYAEHTEKGLRQAVEKLDLESCYSSERIDELIKGGTHLAANHELEQKFFEDPRKCMFLLGIAEEWESTKGFREKRQLLDTLSIVAVSFKKRETLSGKTKKLSRMGRERGIEFDPQAENTRSSYIEMVQREMKRDTDKRATKRIRTQLKDWSEKSILAHARKKLGLTEKTERPVRFVILKLNEQAIKEKYGYIAFCIDEYTGFLRRRLRRAVVFNSETRNDNVEHEYVHSQSEGVDSGFSKIIDRGLNEALTENVVSSPMSYPEQRTALAQLCKDTPKFEGGAYRAYVSGDKEDLLQMDELLIKRYGLRGRLTIARMAMEPYPRYYGRSGDTLINPNTVGERLRELRRKS